MSPTLLATLLDPARTAAATAPAPPSTEAAATPPELVLVFDAHNRLAVRLTPAGLTPLDGASLPALRRSAPTAHTFTATLVGQPTRLHLATLVGCDPLPASAWPVPPLFATIDALAAQPALNSPLLDDLLPSLEPHLVEIPYLHLGENDFIYKFRPAAERNTAIYAQDPASRALYQSSLCTALKLLARRHERTAVDPVVLDFGAVHYIVPSHFGFCLGVKNAIERAYETLAAHPDRRVFMLSELIHNPFVNEDLLRRGLRYLQSDKGIPFTASGRKISAAAPATPADPALWDTLTPADIVIIPAFGATDDDKRRLVRKGLQVCTYDATCMLVEKVWKAARAYGRAGYTVVIHGKHEHEETKATFANTRRHAPAVIVRDLAETRLLGELIASPDPARRQQFYTLFAGRHTPDFDVARHLDRVAVVNQTTLLMNETRAIIDHLRQVFATLHGPDAPGQPPRVGGSGRNDTLCYATQVNQDALARGLATPLDAAFILGGKNSSNTYQLYRLCEQKLGNFAFFIQNETNIHSLSAVEHYVFPASGSGHTGHTEVHPLWPQGVGERPRRILITGGASCPDGIIQQVILRLNQLFPAERLRSLEAVLADLTAATTLDDPSPQPA